MTRAFTAEDAEAQRCAEDCPSGIPFNQLLSFFLSAPLRSSAPSAVKILRGFNSKKCLRARGSE